MASRSLPLLLAAALAALPALASTSEAQQEARPPRVEPAPRQPPKAAAAESRGREERPARRSEATERRAEPAERRTEQRREPAATPPAAPRSTGEPELRRRKS